MTKAWDWRRAAGGSVPNGDLSVFHAYDVNNNAACSPSHGLIASRDEPNEGSKFCAQWLREAAAVLDPQAEGDKPEPFCFCKHPERAGVAHRSHECLPIGPQP